MEEGPKPDRRTRERIRSPFLPVDDAHGRAALESGLPQRLDGLQGSASGGDNILDETNLLSRGELAFESIAGGVLLGRLAHDQEREA